MAVDLDSFICKTAIHANGNCVNDLGDSQE